MDNFLTKKILILYFVITLFFVNAGASNVVQNNEGFNQHTFTEQFVNLSHKNTQLLTIGAVTGEIVAGFTLAEVLITLLIIGIIASIVIPALIADTQEQELKTAWKKAFAEISAAAKIQKANEGSVNVTTLKNYMNVIHDCLVSTTLPQCVMTCPNGWGCNHKPASGDIFITADGAQWGDFLAGADSRCIVDINGLKGPNVINKDVLLFCIMPDGRVLPNGHSECNNPVYSLNALYWLSQ